MSEESSTLDQPRRVQVPLILARPDAEPLTAEQVATHLEQI